MSLKSKYSTVNVYRFSDGGWDSVSGYTLSHTIKGIIQTPAPKNSFNNGKDTSSIVGVLFTGVGSDLQEKDKVSYPDGQSFIVAGVGSQTKGVTGIKSHHAEYGLEFDNVS